MGTQLLRPREVALRLGVAVSTAYGLIQRREIPVVRVGGSVRVPEDGLAEWIRERTEIRTDPEVSDE